MTVAPATLTGARARRSTASRKGIDIAFQLGALLDSVDSDAINERMGYRQPPTAVRRLDDALLCLYGERYIGLHGNAHRVELLRTRLAKLSGDD